MTQDKAFAIVYYDPLQENPRRYGPRSFDFVKLESGRNTLDQRDFETLRSHPEFEEYVKIRAIEVIASEIPEVVNESLDYLDANTAIQVVRDEFDAEKLVNWQKQELSGKKRKTVLNALAIQIKDAKEGTL